MKEKENVSLSVDANHFGCIFLRVRKGKERGLHCAHSGFWCSSFIFARPLISSRVPRSWTSQNTLTYLLASLHTFLLLSTFVVSHTLALWLMELETNYIVFSFLSTFIWHFHSCLFFLQKFSSNASRLTKKYKRSTYTVWHMPSKRLRAGTFGGQGRPATASHVELAST